MKQPFVFILILSALSIILSCSNPRDPQKIIERSISYYQMDKLKNASLEFTFRNVKFKVMQKDGKFRYERTFSDSTGNIQDVLDNQGFTRKLDGQILQLDTKDLSKYSQSLNAVVYFLYLPLKLNDASVIKRYVDEVKIKGKSYHKLEISFDQKDGGADHNDVYYYWFDTQDYSMDHFAYSSGGNRFREVIRTHELEGGVILQDYINYQRPLNDSITAISKYDSLFEAGKLRELSKIEFVDIRLKIIPK